ncbi:hypothetical protein PENTCL1PPCAC_10998, partial [Pristionchus entomophagus]
VTLFFFCKACEFGSTNPLLAYLHFMLNCPRGYLFIKNNEENAEDHASKCIGVCPASLLHFQPINLKTHKADLDKHPEKYVVPSLCSHRSMIVAVERRVTCDTCRCLEANSSHATLYQMRTGRSWGEDKNITTVVSTPPLSRVRRTYEEWIKKRNIKRSVNNVDPRSQPNTSRMDLPSTSRAPTVLTGNGDRLPTSAVSNQAILNSAQEVQLRLNDRLDAAMQARGGMRSENGGAGGGRAPVSTGVNRVNQSGKGMMRGQHVPNQMGSAIQNGGGEGGMRIFNHHNIISSSRAHTGPPRYNIRDPTSVLIDQQLHGYAQQADQKLNDRLH